MTYTKQRALPKLKEILKERKIQQQWIAEELGVTKECVWKICNSQGGSLKMAYAISSLLGVKKADIFEEVR